MILLQATPPWAWGAVLAAVGVGLALLWVDARAREPSPTLRVPAPPDAAPVWIGLGVILIFYVYTPVLFRLLLGAPSAATTAPTMRDLANSVQTGIATYLAATAAGLLIHLYMHSPARRFLGLATPTLRQWRLLLSASLAAIGLTYLASGATQALLDGLGWQHPQSHPMLDWMTRLGDRPGLKWAAILSATVLAPLFEEFFFRGHLQTALAGMLPKRWVAVTITSVLFASLHPWWTAPAIFVLSLCLGALYERTNNLWMPIAMHIAFNSLSTAVFLGQR